MRHDLIGVYLYGTAAAEQAPPAQAICPDIPRALKARKGLISFLHWILCADISADIEFRVEVAVMRIAPVTDLVPIYPSLATCMDDIPHISLWLEDWAQSPNREPDLRPDWALRRNFEFEKVRAIANAIASKIATSKARNLHIELTTGQCATLAIPAHARLVPPQTPDTKTQRTQVKEVSPFMTGVMSTGQQVHVAPAAVRRPSRTDTVDEIQVPRPRTVKVWVAQQVQPLGRGQADVS